MQSRTVERMEVSLLCPQMWLSDSHLGHRPEEWSLSQENGGPVKQGAEPERCFAGASHRMGVTRPAHSLDFFSRGFRAMPETQKDPLGEVALQGSDSKMQHGDWTKGSRVSPVRGWKQTKSPYLPSTV